MNRNGFPIISSLKNKNPDTDLAAGLHPKVAIIILNWNGLNDTIGCLNSVRKIDYPNYKMIVVDNGSRDGTPEAIQELFSEVSLIKNKINLGYAEGNNTGIRYALKNGAEFILLLNNDTIVDPQILKSFIGAAKLHPEAGIFGAKIYYFSDPNRIWFAGAKWDEERTEFCHIGYDQLDNDNKYNRIEEIDYACGCALMFRKEVAEKIGLLNSLFFLTFEETDWCYRARKFGFKSLYIPEAKLWHKVSTSFGGSRSPLYIYFLTRNKLLWAQRNLPFAQRLHIYRNILKNFFPRCHESKNGPLVKRLYRDILEIKKNYKEPECRAVIVGLTDFLFRRFGNTLFSKRLMNKVIIG